MSRVSKILLGILSFLPILLVASLFIFMFAQFRTFIQWDHDPEPGEVFSTFIPMFAIGILLSLVSLGVLIFFIIHLIKGKKMDGTEKAIWVLALILGGIICYPIYWYMKIWKDE